MDTSKPDDYNYAENCDVGHKENTCQAYIKSLLQRGLPNFLRLLELTGSTYQMQPSAGSVDINHEFLNQQKAKQILKKSDEFLTHLSSLDIRLRLNGQNKMSQEQFVEFIGNQALDWQHSETERIRRIMSWINQRIQQLQLKMKLPKILFIKTTGKEEGGFPYTRGDSIILTPEFIRSPDLVTTISHEIFHIWFRNNSDRKTDLYRIFGYTIIDTKAINSCPSANHIISNPDLETVNVGINLDYQGVGYTGIPLVLNKEKENVSAEATLQSNFDFQFCMIDPTNKRKSLMVQASDTNYEKQIGDNTAQTFHPDELLAESFALLLTRNINSLPNPEFIRNLHMTLK